jgi:hypothetical protein
MILMMKAQANVGAMIGIMVALLVGAVMLVPVIFNAVTTATATTDVKYDAIACTNASWVNLRGVQTGTLYFYNSSKVIMTSGNYTLVAGEVGGWGTVYVKFQTAGYGSGGTCYLNYTYYDPSYMNNSTTRTLYGLLPILAAILLVTVVVAYMKFS